MRLTNALRRAARINRGVFATIDGERRRDWPQTLERIARLAAALRDLGVADGDRVAVLALNSTRYFECFYGAWWAGAVIVPLNVRWAAPEIAYSLADSGASVLVVDQAFAPLLPALAGRGLALPRVVYAGDGVAPGGTRAYEDLLGGATPCADRLRGGDDIAGIFYTGGTTGVAKGVMLSHANLFANALSNIAQLQLRDDEVYLHAAPMFHLADGLSTWGVTMVGGTHVFISRFEPALVMEAIGRHVVTFTTLVPTMVQRLLDHPAWPLAEPRSLRTLFYGGSPMPERVARQVIAALPRCRIFGAYGMTELSPIATVLDARYHTLEGPHAGKLASVGQPALGLELRIVGVDDRELPPGEVGEIVVRGPTVMLGYWNKPEATAAALRDGWLHSGDAGYMDAQGFLYVADRLKDMIVSGGENVYSAEVENALYQHPAVSQCAVIGVPDARWGERVHAVIVLHPGTAATEAELIGHCRELIAGYKCPRSVAFRTDPLPLSGAGKVLKNELRAAPHATAEVN
jgi:long-chain acyl-CoA synthetase